jgi:hypothetical protein
MNIINRQTLDFRQIDEMITARKNGQLNEILKSFELQDSSQYFFWRNSFKKGNIVAYIIYLSKLCFRKNKNEV